MPTPRTFTSILDLTTALADADIQPITLHWEQLPTRTQWSIQVPTCHDLARLTTAWHGKRCDKRDMWHGTRLRHADIGPEGLLTHVCHAGLPCWEPPDYDLLGGVA